MNLSPVLWGRQVAGSSVLMFSTNSGTGASNLGQPFWFMRIRSVAVYCGSSSGTDPGFLKAAQTLGATLAENGITLVYGGGDIGLMGALADSALEAKGTVIGVIPHFLIDKEVGHTGLTKCHAVETMHERKMKMADLADAFIALPGGFGTLEEISEIFTWNQLGIHGKPCALLNVSGFYDPLIAFLRSLVDKRFVRQEHLDALLVAADVGPLLDQLIRYTPHQVGKWIDRKKK